MTNLAFGNLPRDTLFTYGGSIYIKLSACIGIQYLSEELRERYNRRTYMWNVWNITRQQLGSFKNTTTVTRGITRDILPHEDLESIDEAFAQCATHCAQLFVRSTLAPGVEHPQFDPAHMWEILVEHSNVVHWFTVNGTVDECTITPPRAYQHRVTMQLPLSPNNPWHSDRLLPANEDTDEAVFHVCDFNHREKEVLKKMSIPKQSHILALLQEDMTTCTVRFRDGHAGRPTDELSSRGYTYKITLGQASELRRALAEGQDRMRTPAIAINVLGKAGIRVGYVTSVDDEPQIDLDADYEYKWIIGRIDMTQYNALMAREQQARDILREAERVKRRKELLAALGFDNGNAQLGERVKCLLNGRKEADDVREDDVREKVYPAPTESAAE